MFKKKLELAMRSLHLNQSQVANLVGKSKGSISQYLAGKQIPSEDVQRDIAVSLGLDADYFIKSDSLTLTVQKATPIRRLSIKEAASLLGVDKVTVSKGLQQGVFPWGYGVKTSENHWVYIINADKFYQIEGVIGDAVSNGC